VIAIAEERDKGQIETTTATALATLSPVSSKQRPPVPTSAISTTQTPTTTAQSKTTAAISSIQGQPAQPPPLSQLKSTTTAQRTMPTQTSKSAAPSLPVPAKPPNIRTTKYTMVQPPGRKGKSPTATPSQTSSKGARKSSGVPIQRTLMSRSTSTRTGLSAPRTGPSKSTTSASGQTALQPTPGTEDRKVTQLTNGKYVEYRDMSPDRIDVFSLMATVGLDIHAQFVHVEYRNRVLDRVDSESFDSSTRNRFPAAGQPDYLEGNSESESTPMEIKIERPPHTLSERDQKSYRILSTSDGHPEQVEGNHIEKNAETAPPVLNVVWEPTGGATAQ
ncbi:hypothetical protein OSTOST_04138, partial [Ostertagia ostertagi]